MCPGLGREGLQTFDRQVKSCDFMHVYQDPKACRTRDKLRRVVGGREARAILAICWVRLVVGTFAAGVLLLRQRIWKDVHRDLLIGRGRVKPHHTVLVPATPSHYWGFYNATFHLRFISWYKMSVRSQMRRKASSIPGQRSKKTYS